MKAEAEIYASSTRTGCSARLHGALNAGKAGLLAAEVAQDDVELLWKLIEQQPGLEIGVNLQDRTVTAGTVVVPFNIDDYTAWRLLEGLDDIGLTLRKLDQIEEYESSRPDWKPRTLPA